MSSLQLSHSSLLQKAACMLLAVVIVSTSITLGVLGLERGTQQRYSVTIRQLS